MNSKLWYGLQLVQEIARVICIFFFLFLVKVGERWIKGTSQSQEKVWIPRRVSNPTWIFGLNQMQDEWNPQERDENEHS